MDAYYNNQISLPYFAGAARQRGSGLGALAASIIPLALPLFRNVLFPTAKKFAKNLAVEALPHVGDAIHGKTSFKKAAKRSLSNATVKTLQQRGSGGKASKIRRRQVSDDRQALIPPPSPPKKVKTFSKQKKRVKRSRYDILGNLKR